MRVHAVGLVATALLSPMVSAAELAGTVQKPVVDVYAQPMFEAPKITTLQQNATVNISAQQGLWYQLRLAEEKRSGYVRVNDVRIAYAGAEDGEANLRVLMGGKAGAGRVTETAGVRGIDESDLKSAALDQAQLNAMVGNRVEPAAAASYAQEHGWQATTVAYAAEATPGKKAGKAGANTAASKGAMTNAVGGVLGSLGINVGSKVGAAAKAVPKSEDELAAEELALGPEIAGRVLGARPLWNDAGAQQRVNRIGRWVASQTSRPELPWAFGVIDTPEINAFAAPGGYVLMTRGLYELLASDAEVAAALGHEISHCVQRDHYNVIRQQELAAAGKDAASSRIDAGTGSVAGNYARQYVEKYGATVMLSTLDREAEFRSDEAAEVYLARAGMNPLALYAVLQKMAALGVQSASLVQLVKTHPAFDARLDRIDRRGFAGLEAYLARD